MEIYIVQPGDTIFSISQKYNIPYEKLVQDNNISPDYSLVNGQLILIANPEKTYTVKDGDTLKSIATENGIPIIQLVQNNPNLSDRDYFYIGEELIINYVKNEKPLELNAYCFSYIDINLLKKSLPYLTYLTIADYKVSATGEILSPNDSVIIQMAKEYGVAPIMMLSTFTEQGKGSYGITSKILNDPKVQNTLIDNTLYVLREKGLYAVNLGFQFILPQELPNYINFMINLKDRIQSEGFRIFTTLIPNTLGYDSNGSNTTTYFSQIGQIVDCVILMSYQWSASYIPTVVQSAIPFLHGYVDYVVKQIPPEKILLGYTRIAYDWELPYVEGESPVTSLANSYALFLSSLTDATIQFDDYYKTPYFYYSNLGIEHFVWFKDARTLNEIINLALEYNLKGISIWNIMDYTPQLWLTFNSQYFTPKILNITSELLN
jgi:spore germination protein